jgi:NitT/TauT family transport system substrate-binding protein
MRKIGLRVAMLGAMLAATAVAVMVPAAAEKIKIGTLKVAGAAPLFVAEDKGYFKAEGLDIEFVFFDAGQPTALAVVAGSVDIGVAALGAGIYALAGQGGLRIIAAQTREVAGFHNGAYLVSNRAYEAGLRSLKDIKGHSVAMTVMGGPFHYALGLLAEKNGFDLSSVTLRPMQSLANNISAVIGGQVDVAIAPLAMAQGAIARGDAKVLGYIGEETPWQLSVVFAANRTGNERRDMVEAFLRAYRKGVHDSYDAFTDANGNRKNMETASETLAILSKHLGQPADRLTDAVEYIDRDARLDMKDIVRQIAWFKAQNLLKVDAPLDQVVDLRYAVPLPDK